MSDDKISRSQISSMRSKNKRYEYLRKSDRPDMNMSEAMSQRLSKLSNKMLVPNFNSKKLKMKPLVDLKNLSMREQNSNIKEEDQDSKIDQ